MLGKPKANLKPGTYTLTMDVFANDRQYFSEKFDVIVTKPLTIRIIKNFAKKWWWVFVLLVIFSIIGFFVYRILKKKYFKDVSLIEKKQKPKKISDTIK